MNTLTTSTPKPVLADDQRAVEAVEPAHREAVERGLADMQSGSLVTDQEIDEAFGRFTRTSR